MPTFPKCRLLTTPPKQLSSTCARVLPSNGYNLLVPTASVLVTSPQRSATLSHLKRRISGGIKFPWVARGSQSSWLAHTCILQVMPVRTRLAQTFLSMVDIVPRRWILLRLREQNGFGSEGAKSLNSSWFVQKAIWILYMALSSSPTHLIGARGRVL